MASSNPQLTMAWLVLPPTGLRDPHTTALFILHKSFPLAAIRFEQSRNGRFLLIARGDGVAAISTLAEMDAWTFEKEDDPTGVSFDGQAILSPSAFDAARNGSYGDVAKASNLKSSTSDSDSSAADAVANLKVCEPFVKVASMHRHDQFC